MTDTRRDAPAGSAAERQRFPDEIRGLSLLGIVVVNVPFLGLSLGGFGSVGGASAQSAEFVITLLAQGKFYLLFAFLFGYSATFLLRPRNAAAPRQFARRLAGLLVLGIAHALLLFVGDILVIYAVLGVALLAAHRASDRALLRAAGVAGGLTAVWFAVLVALTYAAPGPSGASAEAAGSSEVAVVTAYDQAMAGGFLETVAARWEVYPAVLLLLGFVLNGGLSLAMFLLGMVAGRHGTLADPAAHPRLWRAARRWGLAVGLPGALAAAVLTLGPADPGQAAAFQSGGQYTLGVLLGFISAPALSAGYLGLLAALVSRWPRALAAFRPAGQMSLSVYVGESAVLAALFCGWGLGLFGRLDPWAVLGVAVVTWAILDLAAHLWLRRLRYGPLEYLLRWWTRGSRPRLARERRQAHPDTHPDAHPRAVVSPTERDRRTLASPEVTPSPGTHAPR